MKKETLKKQIKKLKTGDLYKFKNILYSQKAYTALYLGNFKFFILNHYEIKFNNQFYIYAPHRLTMFEFKIEIL